MSALGDPGLIIDRGMVENNALSHVSTWIVSYLANQERYQTPPLAPRSIALPASFDIVTEFTRFPEDQLPFVAVVSTGVNPTSTRREGDGTIVQAWSLAVGAIVSADTALHAKVLAGFYGAAIKGLMLDMPQLGGWASFTDLADERYDDFQRAEERQLAAARLVFSVEVQGVLSLFRGFKDFDGNFTVPVDPYAVPTDYPIVESTDAIDAEISGESE